MLLLPELNNNFYAAIIREFCNFVVSVVVSVCNIISTDQIKFNFKFKF